MTPEIITAIIDTTAGVYAVDPLDVTGKPRTKRVSEARADAMAELADLGLSLSEIGSHFGRHASTVHWILKHRKGAT